ncbi:MAG: shikimate dehydrogenase [Candidatus Didemnitutus sp.]|nr:shikimate dehydrogenase [Candidatus Didemnitutus sp.]
MPRSDSTRTLTELATEPGPQVGLGLLGFPVSHSISPAMHNAALAMLARDEVRFGTWRYEKFSVAPGELAQVLPVLHAKGFVGLNLTVPHKEAVLDHVEAVDEFVRAAGAANTLVRTETGWRATNTDGGGLTDALKAEFNLSLAGRNVILLGAGGAARAAAAQCLRHAVASLWIYNRSRDRLALLLNQLRPHAGAVPLHGFTGGNFPDDLPTGALVINATTLGLKKGDPSPLDLRRVPLPGHVYDMIYNPPATPLLQQAAALAIPRANGLSMLVHQGARSLALWTGRPVPIATMHRAAGEMLTIPVQ